MAVHYYRFGSSISSFFSVDFINLEKKDDDRSDISLSPSFKLHDSVKNFDGGAVVDALVAKSSKLLPSTPSGTGRGRPTKAALSPISTSDSSIIAAGAISSVNTMHQHQQPTVKATADTQRKMNPPKVGIGKSSATNKGEKSMMDAGSSAIPLTATGVKVSCW